MKAYEAGSPAYFATPPVNLIYAYRASLNSIVLGGTCYHYQSHFDEAYSLFVVSKDLPLEKRLKLHGVASRRVKDAAKKLGLRQLPESEGEAANGMTAVSDIPTNIGFWALMFGGLLALLS